MQISDLIKNLENIIGEPINDTGLIKQALTHRSYLNEAGNTKLTSNERLEFLGDSVLQMWVSNYIYKFYPHLNEGKLTAIRTHLVRTETLAKLAEQLSFGDHLLLSRGEEKDNGRHSQLLLANCFEALSAAIFVSNGQNAIHTFFNYLYKTLILEIKDPELLKDSKSLLQEKTQINKKLPPKYEVISSTGPDHQRTFTMAVSFDGKTIGKGTGNSKQAAEEQAAKNALVYLGIKR